MSMPRRSGNGRPAKISQYISKNNDLTGRTGLARRPVAGIGRPPVPR
jgi:hypothetical protein